MNTPFAQRRTFKVDKILRAEERIKSNVWDIDAWSVILRDAQAKKIEDARDSFERIITQFPMSGQYWKIYIQQEMKARNYERVEKLFQKCLIKILNIDLWKLYLQYIKETKAEHPNFKEKMAQAYDFTLDKMGLDLNSYSIWSDYITFLRSAQVQGSYAESQKITATRRVYQRAIITPMQGIETVWRDYCTYENSINPHIAKKLTEERCRDYMNARKVTKEYEIITKGLSRNIPSVPPQVTPFEVKQVELWKKYIQWEKDNPLKTEDHITITKRVMFAYEQCLLCMGHHPDIWYEAASFLEQASKQLTGKGDQIMARQFADDTAAMYERAIMLLRSNIMLYFAYADYEEGRCKYAKVHSIYKKLISLENIDPTLPYIQYMRFARRCEGILSARVVFKMARDDHRVGYQVYVSAALMEYYCSKDTAVGHKIFELGIKRFAGNSDFVLCYVDYMAHLNEDNNTRVLFERALGSEQIPGERARSIWARFLQFELQVGDLASIQKIEKRRLKTCEHLREFQGRETALLIDRYRFLDLFPCSESELRSLGYRELAKLNLTGMGSGSLLPSGASGNPEDVGGGGSGEFGGVSGGVSGCAGVLDGEALGGGGAGSSGGGVSIGGGGGGKQPTYPQPDVSQMLAFKPKAYPRTGSHPVAGGEFPPPPTASALIHILPPPNCFHGPFVQVDKFLEHFMDLEIPEDYLAQVMAESEDMAMNNIDAGTAISIEVSNTAPQQLLVAAAAAARRRKAQHQQQQQQEGGGGEFFGRKRTLGSGNTNAFGDSDDEAVGGAADLEDGENGGASDFYADDYYGADGDEDGMAGGGGGGGSAGISAAGCGGAVDLFRLRQVKRHHGGGPHAT